MSPRVGATWALDGNTVLRGGYGLFYAPWQFTQQSHGTIGFTRTTTMLQSAAETAVPLATLENPFPTGLIAPTGSALGILTGVGGNVDFIDQNKGAPRVHQYAVDVQRQLRGDMAVSLGYIGSTGRDIGYGGFTNTGIEINQIDPATLPKDATGRWDAAALRRSVPNPFFGVPGTGELGTAATILAGQLLRPFPQFNNVTKLQVTEGGRRQYHAMVLKVDKRTTGVWGGTFNYTWSRMMDNQWGQSNTYGASSGTPQNYYDLDAEYRHQQHRHAASHRARADRADSRSGPRVEGDLAARRLDGVGGGRVRERAADLGVRDGPVGRQPGTLQRPAAAESAPGSRS